MRPMRSFLLLFSLLIIPVFLTATHNRAGEIIVRQGGDCGNINEQNVVCATIITYTETAQTQVDRDSLILNWGDGDSDVVARSNGGGRGVPLGNGIKRNEYTICHRYPGPDRYFLSFQDQNRVANVLNIDGGRSINIPFSVYTVYTLSGPFGQGCNNSPELSQIPIENACIGSVWTHNPGAFDVDGDSLAFEFTTPQRAPNVPVRNYLLPNEQGGTTGSLTLNELTGQITWNAPARAGEYNLAFFVKSFRNGQILDTLVRDMQIFVGECNNEPPTLDLPDEEICVVAGELIEFDVIAGAPLADVDQLVRLGATGRPFDIPNAATFLPVDSSYRADPLTRTFRWRPECAEISDQPYFVVFRAEDNFFDLFNIGGRSGGLSALRTVAIKVVAPPPENLRAEIDDDNIVTLTWDEPYACEDQVDPQFIGFNVYRRVGSNPFEPDTCQTGLEGRGYTLLNGVTTTEMMDGDYVYVDEDLEPGRTYCYRAVAVLGQTIIELGTTFGRDILSIPSAEVCVQLPREIPLLTKVDVLETDAADGEIDVCWILPEAEALDTILNPGPYRYVLSRATGQTGDLTMFSEITSFTRETFAEPIDTCFTDTGLDTDGTAFSYRIELFTGGRDENQGDAPPASSLRLSGGPTDLANELNWAAQVPWANLEYDVLRRAPGETEFTVIATTIDANYRDEGLMNGDEYCYIIRSSGTYNVDGLPEPLINNSQELCLVPLDNVAPCPPALTVVSPCDREVDCTDQSTLFNSLAWSNPLDVCGDTDVAGYRVYFSSGPDEPSVQVAEIDGASTLSYDDFPTGGITGCYTVTAIDNNGNESDTSNVVCVINCPIYELPNAFTPNGDGQNERFVPTSRCFIERVDFQIFNRWGQLVFETEDPALEWDGKNGGGDDLASGTYYYVGTVFEQQLDGVAPAAAQVSGYIELVRGE